MNSLFSNWMVSMFHKLDNNSDEKPAKSNSLSTSQISNALYKLGQTDVMLPDRRQKSNRRSSIDQRTCFRFNSTDSDQESYIVTREPSAKDKSVVDVRYDVVMQDHSSGGFGFLIEDEINLQVGHVIRLSTNRRLHQVRIRSVRPIDGEEFLMVGVEYIEDMLAEEPPNLSVLELFVDRRNTVGRMKGTVILVFLVILTWLGILAYAWTLE